MDLAQCLYAPNLQEKTDFVVILFEDFSIFLTQIDPDLFFFFPYFYRLYLGTSMACVVIPVSDFIEEADISYVVISCK